MDQAISEKTMQRLEKLLVLQSELENRFGNDGYNIYVFGSYITNHYVEGKSDIDIAIYSKSFQLYKELAGYVEEYFENEHVNSDIFYIDIRVPAPLYCAPLRSKVQFTDYEPEELKEFRVQCENVLRKTKEKMAG